ncbi:MAG TPA: hypothetical protein PKH03_08330, partial [Syntrophales bacterium]|nr:hypothetical protein [Syntrophales bacterium]
DGDDDPPSNGNVLENRIGLFHKSKTSLADAELYQTLQPLSTPGKIPIISVGKGPSASRRKALKKQAALPWLTDRPAKWILPARRADSRSGTPPAIDAG